MLLNRLPDLPALPLILSFLAQQTGCECVEDMKRLQKEKVL